MGAELKHPLYSEKESKMDKAKLKEGIQKYTMIIVLVLVTLFFTWGTQGKILLPQNITNLIRWYLTVGIRCRAHRFPSIISAAEDRIRFSRLPRGSMRWAAIISHLETMISILDMRY